jgi:hypothetical protein
MMLPGKIVGTVITGAGAEPFELDVPTGKVRTGSYVGADPDQRKIGSMEREAIERQVKGAVSGAREVRIGSFQCPTCKRWVDVVKDASSWKGDHCNKC